MKKVTSVLIVDDDERFSEEIRHMFSANSYSVVTAQTASEGIAALKKFPADVVLLDKKLPDMDGQLLVSEIKKIRRDCDIVIVTAYGDMDSAVRGIKDGVSDYVMKPADPEILLESVKKIDKKRKLGK